MEHKIIEYWLNNQFVSFNWIAKIFEISTFEVGLIIERYKKKPYIIMESKINEMEIPDKCILKSKTWFIWNYDLEVFEPKKYSITQIELIVLDLILKQLTSKEISLLLNKSARSIEKHRESILYKTNSKNSIGLVYFAIKNKLIFIK
jgi:DNA-binding CsgD family transcriptional regulator